MTAHDERIARYVRAYENANGKPFLETVVYDRGWYRFKNKWRQTRACRAADLEEWIQRLQWRASPDGQQFYGSQPNPPTPDIDA